VIVNTTIYYFTGTGNSLKIAKDISKGVPHSELRNIAKAIDDREAGPISGKAGIIYPVYAEGLPLLVEKFVRSLKIPHDTYVFSVANYGESAGGSLVQLENILLEKGCSLSAAFGLKMPDNTQILFPPSPEEWQNKDFEHEAAGVDDIVRTIIQGMSAGKSLIQDMRRTLGPFWRRPDFNPHKMSENFTADEKCDGCALCEKICPVRNIVMNMEKPRWLERCELCLACMQWCPKEAIQFSVRTSSWGRYHHPAIAVEELLRK
jgi:ferredoxin